MKKIRNTLIAYGISTFFFLYAFIQFFVVYFFLPFPERFSIAELDALALSINEDISFILLIVSFVIMLISALLFIIFGLKLFNLSINKYSIFEKWHKNKWWHFWYIFFVFMTIIFPMIMVFIYLYNYLRIKKKTNNNDRELLEKKIKYSYNLRPTKKFIRIYQACVPATLCCTATIIVPIIMTQPKRVYVNKNDVNNFLNMSNNNENTLMLYFDRAQGMIWNTLLAYDYFLNKENSFITLFPKFTSYTKTVSQGRVTNVSNPSLVSGHLYSSWMNDYDERSLYSNKKYSDMSINDIWSEAFYNEFKMLESKGVTDIHISSVPYYSYNGNTYGEPNLFNDAINKVSNINFALTTNEAIASYKLNDDSAGRMTNAEVLKESKNLIKFKNTNGMLYQGWYFHHTHEQYCYYDYNQNKFIQSKSRDYKYFMESMWFTIQELKNFLTTLKNEPWNNGSESGNVYDHTQIIVVSDHGYSLPKKDADIDKMLLWVRKEFNIEDNFLPIESPLLSYNNIFMFKPFSKINNINNDITNFFDKETLILSSDFPLILEEGLNSIKGLSDRFYFLPDLNKINNPKLREYFKQIIVTNPMLNKEKLSNRKIRFEASDWRFQKNLKYNTVKTFDIDASNKDFSELFSSEINFN